MFKFHNPHKLCIRRNTPGEDGGNGGGTEGRNGDNPADEGNSNSDDKDPLEGKSPEEIANAYKELQKQFTSVSTQAAKADELEQLLFQVMSALPQNKDGEDGKKEDSFVTEEEALNLFKDPKGTLENLFKKVLSTATSKTKEELDKENKVAEQRAEIRKTFYDTNKDLVGKEILVGVISDMVQRANPNVHPAKLMPKIAELTREEIKKLTGTSSSANNNLGSETNGRKNDEELPANQKQINSLIARHRR